MVPKTYSSVDAGLRLDGPGLRLEDALVTASSFTWPTSGIMILAFG